MKSILPLLLLGLFLFSCTNENKQSTKNILSEIPTPCKAGGEPNLFVAANGTVYLSWIEYVNDSLDALLFSTLENDKWSSPKKIAESENWFVNWADYPSLVVSNNNIAAHWLEKKTPATFDYDVHISQSSNNGNTWSPSFVIHKDSIAAEHGFVSMMPMPNGRFFATWLDGRNTKLASENKQQHGHGGGPMSLRTAEFDVNGNIFEEQELDNRICDCCQTDVALSTNGPVVVYRDRSEEEIRDIYITRKIDNKWTNPKAVFADNWHISGCPVNGPAISANGNQLAVAWFGKHNKKAEVKIAFSNDDGANFQKPIKIDDGQPLGRVDVLWIDNNELAVSWMEDVDDKAIIKIAKVNTNGTVEKFDILSVSASRKSGFPILTKLGEELLLAWTEVGADDFTRIKTAKIHL